MVTVQITPKMVELALFAEREQDANVRTKHNYTGLETHGRRYIGAIGELGFANYLFEQGVAGDYRPRYNGLSDSGDMHVFLDDLYTTIDVKTASLPIHKYIMVPKIQWAKTPNYIYIGVRLNESNIEIIGYCRRNDLKEADYTVRVKVPTMVRSLDDLLPIEDLVAKLEKGKMDIDIPSQTEMFKE